MNQSLIKDPTFRKQSGQIVLEYILLLMIGVAAAALITSTMVSRDPNNPGFLIVKWMKIIQTIGADTADDPAAAPSP